MRSWIVKVATKAWFFRRSVQIVLLVIRMFTSSQSAQTALVATVPPIGWLTISPNCTSKMDSPCSETMRWWIAMLATAQRRRCVSTESETNALIVTSTIIPLQKIPTTRRQVTPPTALNAMMLLVGIGFGRQAGQTTCFSR